MIGLDLGISGFGIQVQCRGLLASDLGIRV